MSTFRRAACVLVALLCLASEAKKHVDKENAGSGGWKEARKASGERELWDQPNACDPQVMQSSAPLSVLFALGEIWDGVRQKREAAGQSDKPLEVHVLGAAYPFEGRSNWTMLADRLPAGVPKVRVRLILGTPFQSDNVPPLHNQPNALLQRDMKPVSGKWVPSKEEVVCKGKGKWGTGNMDQDWSKEDLCRDHGGVEVVCVEKFYQDVRATLPKPDMAVMFSPGFPQLGRRSWDDVLIGLLNDEVPTMLSDVIELPSWGYELTVRQFGDKPVLPGARWDPSKGIGEDWQTWLAMKKYGARKVMARRGPFPILHHEGGGTLAKNAVIQVYQGYKPSRKPTPPLSAEFIEKYQATFKKTNWKAIAQKGHGCDSEDLKKVFAAPTSRPFDNAVRQMYIEEFKKQARKHEASFTAKQRARLQKYGVLAQTAEPVQKPKRWGLKAWVFLVKTLGCVSF